MKISQSPSVLSSMLSPRSFTPKARSGLGSPADLLDDGELAEFERLIDVPDRELLAWVTGEAEVPPSFDTALFRRMRDFNTQGGELRR